MHAVDIETTIGGRAVCVLGHVQGTGAAIVDRVFTLTGNGERAEMDAPTRWAFVARHGAWLTSIMLAAAGVDEETC